VSFHATHNPPCSHGRREAGPLLRCTVVKSKMSTWAQ
jgi:hypothetical protein